MYGLSVLLALSIYIGFCYWLIRYTARKSSSHGRIWGLVVFLIYNGPLIYYVVIPGVVQKVLCSTDAGFWLYKTPEQWEAENPGVAETLKVYKNSRRDRFKNESVKGYFDFTDIYHLNDRFDWVVDYKYVLQNLVRKVESVVDVNTEEIMTRRVDFYQQEFKYFGNKLLSGCYKKKEQSRWLVDGNGDIFYRELFREPGDKGQ